MHTTTITIPNFLAAPLRAWLSGPDATRAAKKSAEKTHADRMTAAAERANVDRQRLALHQTFIKNEAAAVKAVHEAEAVVTAAVAALAGVRGEYQATKFPLEQRFDVLTRELDAAEPETLAVFRQDMEAEIARTHSMGYSNRAPFGDVVRSNWASVNARIAAIIASRVLVNDLRYEALTDSELADRLQSIRDGWPAIVDVETAA